MTSKSLFDLNLPAVGPGEGPVPLPEPSYELVREHALFLLRSRQSPEAPANQTPVPEPFVLD
ncbi:MAG: hypothetical protein ACOYMS_03725 [Terrimicrobiaceae bacterium]